MVDALRPELAQEVTPAAVVWTSTNAPGDPPESGARSISNPVSMSELSVQPTVIWVLLSAPAEGLVGAAGTTYS